MKLSTIIQWALAGQAAHIRNIKFQEEMEAENLARGCQPRWTGALAEVLAEERAKALNQEQELIDLLVKIRKGELHDEHF